MTNTVNSKILVLLPILVKNLNALDKSKLRIIGIQLTTKKNNVRV